MSFPPWVGRLLLGQPLPRPPGELNIVSGRMPSTCEVCLEGGRLILTLGERCPKKCFYCSNPYERSDRSSADDFLVHEPSDVLRVAETTRTRSLCLTGGEPTCYLEQALAHTQQFRQRMGPAFHVHFFTGRGRLRGDVLHRLRAAGIQEIRFHVSSPAEMTGVRRALELPWDVAVEVPALPEPLAAVTLAIVEASIALGVAFVNLHELLHMPTPAFIRRLRKYKWHLEEPLYIKVPSRKRRVAGLRPGDMACQYGMPRYAVTGSRETGLRALRLPGAGESTTVHFCSAASKYFVQVPQRLGHRARLLARPYEQVTPESTLFHILVSCGDRSRAQAVRRAVLSGTTARSEQVQGEGDVLRVHPVAALQLIRNRGEWAPDAAITFSERYPAPEGSRLHPQADFLEFVKRDA